eukprot:CAMPEP_0173124930 /NCGR_PEP_ID=MMETSP1102-20130122/56029_1 /TAXON_ID=49646 /ORGANISM="Geminigera sp., Strain Caron Lab Isolate" /LENGTH=179 /DNA_ID=CAMNT_0014033531 /DNA_START=8 /DNA_END=543 /DNA_ORIENTATION=-
MPGFGAQRLGTYLRSTDHDTDDDELEDLLLWQQRDSPGTRATLHPLPHVPPTLDMHRERHYRIQDADDVCGVEREKQEGQEEICEAEVWGAVSGDSGGDGMSITQTSSAFKETRGVRRSERQSRPMPTPPFLPKVAPAAQTENWAGADARESTTAESRDSSSSRPSSHSSRHAAQQHVG